MRCVRHLRSSNSSSEKSQPSLLSLRRMQATTGGTSHCVSKTGSVIHVTQDESNGHVVHHPEQLHTNWVSTVRAAQEQSERTYGVLRYARAG